MDNKEIKTTIYYVVENGGDGSAYPTFFENEELRNWYYDVFREGDGEYVFGDSNGSITVSGSSEITSNSIITPNLFFFKYLLEEWNYQKSNPDWIEKVKDFIDRFIKSYPKWKVTTETSSSSEEYLYNKVCANCEFIGEVFKKKENSGKVLEDLLNDLPNILSKM